MHIPQLEFCQPARQRVERRGNLGFIALFSLSDVGDEVLTPCSDFGSLAAGRRGQASNARRQTLFLQNDEFSDVGRRCQVGAAAELGGACGPFRPLGIARQVRYGSPDANHPNWIRVSLSEDGSDAGDALSDIEGKFCGIDRTILTHIRPYAVLHCGNLFTRRR